MEAERGGTVADNILGICQFVGALFILSCSLVGAYVILRWGFTGVEIIWKKREVISVSTRKDAIELWREAEGG